MAIFRLRNISLAFGPAKLLDNTDFAIDVGERVCVIGRNGEGKSSMLKVVAGELKADDGIREINNDKIIRMLEQEVPKGTTGKVYDVVAEGLGEQADLIHRYHEITLELADICDEKTLDRLAKIQHELDAADAWALQQQVDTVLSRLSLDADVPFEALSGGKKRRVLLARALVAKPDLLLLDEPTNHLDVESIAWLEEFLLSWNGALLFITHDRSFLRKLATRIVELDRGQLTSWPGDYENYLRRKEERANAEQLENARFDKRLAQEEVWIRQGIKARRTRNEGRVRALKDMREQFRQRRAKQGTAKLQLSSGDSSGKKVIEVDNVSYAWDDQPIVKDFSTLIMRGNRIGLLGPNGCGKSTLLGLLLGQLKPDQGTVETGTNLKIAYYDQLRQQLDENATVMDNVGGGQTNITVNGTEKHVISYLQDFLFTPDRIRQPVKALSGGERNRLLLAKLFIKPANFLVMDEPTNDLDVETLELLEELLLNYDGTLLLVSHDRAFLDNVVTSLLVFTGDAKVEEFYGGFSDWQEFSRKREERQATRPVSKAAPEIKKATSKNKLTYKEQLELDKLPKQLEMLESQTSDLHEQLNDPDLYQKESSKAAELSAQLKQLEAELETAYERWETLEARQEG